jgi:hypothetical protein
MRSLPPTKQPPLTSQWLLYSAPVTPRACSSAYGTFFAPMLLLPDLFQHMLQNLQLALKLLLV